MLIRFKKCLIGIGMSLSLLVLSCSPILAAEQNDAINEFIQWTDNVMNLDTYDVILKDGSSCKSEFMSANHEYYKNKNYQKILDYFRTNELRYSFIGEEIQTRALATTKTQYKLFYHNGENEDCEFTATIKLSITIRVDENTGVIRSYEGPSLTLISLTSNIVSGQMKNITTSATYSDSHRTITAKGSYDIVLYPANIPGLADQVFGRFNDSFVAG